MGKVYHSSDKMDWGTPNSVFDPLDAEFNFTLDVCASSDNAKCFDYFDEKEDGLAQEWKGHQCWMNPPYGREIGQWVQKAWDQKHKGVTTVCLIPARTDTKMWSIFWDHDCHKTRDAFDEVRFIKGRVKFEGAEQGAPFPSAIIVMHGVVAKRWCSKCASMVRPADPCTKYFDRACGLNQDTYNENDRRRT